MSMGETVPGYADPHEHDAFAELLLRSHLVTPEALTFAREVELRTGASFDQVLISEGLLDSESLLIAEAEAWGVLPIDLEAVKFDDTLVRMDENAGQRFLAENWLPIKRDDDGRVFVATAREPSPERAARIQQAIGAEPRFVATTSWNIKNACLRLFRSEIADSAANELWRQNPAMSARITFSRGQKVGSAVAGLGIAVCAVMWPVQTAIALLTLVSLVFLAGTSFKFIVAMRGAGYDVVERVSRADVAALDDRDLPRYTVLVPVFREANIVAQLIRNLGGIDYPIEKLEVLILVEEEDHDTRDAVLASDPPPHFRIVTIPKGQPQTKPRACNVGLYFATGDYLVIYDAEDTPDPDQLKKAVVAFARGGEETVCVQAALNYFNNTENVLTRMFTLEYSYWFDYMLAGLDIADLPIPLGGTSNHFRTSALLELGGWDPYNVTEDADLGIRASALGYRVGVINSTTMEEANTSIPNFIRQRSRWIKGYMQTSLVHARQPVALIRQIGWVRFLSFVLLIAGTPLTFLGVIPAYLLTAITLALPTELVAPFFPVWLLWLTLLNFVVGNVIMIYLSMMGPYRRGAFHLVLWALLNPVYWLLHSWASYKGLWQLITKPHYWEKTEHGLTKQDAHG
ncbi:cellulose synthase/poly-beta-1,6-N-acetylglucosamine synthase-like glycosyltransferase [Microcella alkaliphila]|uniref:Cellulose synthase/poly-beta-1,6-N-acetylglucosamine synthase-like glycosyltransferase n=1 Tax=Microcella alkaliphila TaxID=279828 RepID=A0A4Q7TTA9_9MICO|nr:glycosyltransferase [Microcella alkaliphila]RZT64225.1 cellulose synthase/poly-beta-1,6-N-acetylglucosamine synthase-like glycosyltransferase [Microcella alkaliphila]